MSDYNNEFRLIKSKIRSKKLPHRVDVTAMVSVSFLLIAFYMVSVELLKPKAMNLGLPEECGGCGNGGCYRNDRLITLLLDDKNQIISYRGMIEIDDETPKKLNYGKSGIRKELLNITTGINQLYGNDKGAIVIIKPTQKTTFKNLVDILDEMAITNIPTYAIVNELSPEEMNLLASN
ncbi:ExbD/TolR family protein [Flavobacterium sp.]|uniref:ExbD/TolR family protein n=1 Tax=Flavobacterium sp. TaxID=239 RepID=UPI002B4B2118|nr:biopolymer transporter ExbD [Flavobacterium sp.]HLP65170.1 biopolymer transporter ExbD [Flavobacterium sp.]